jgi:hypothetical protein
VASSRNSHTALSVWDITQLSFSPLPDGPNVPVYLFLGITSNDFAGAFTGK